MARLFSGMLRTYAHMVRYRHIFTVLLKYGFVEAAGVIAKKFRFKSFKKRAGPGKRVLHSISTAERLRLAMEEMGPTFIKLGQLLSTRPDLIPVNIAEELEKLQDQVRAEKFEDIKAVIYEELGGEPENLFRSFDPDPIAAASIAQVHKAVTLDGEDVVLKIQRPHIEKIIETDLEIMEDLAALAMNRFDELKSLDPLRMVKDFTNAIHKEINFHNERRNQKRFIKYFAKDETMHVPRLYEDLCTSKILTMEYVQGLKPDNRERLLEAGLDPQIIARRGADFILKQIFEFGLFHADPHPGNFFIIEENVLAPFDFGQVGRLTTNDRELLQSVALAVINREIPKIILKLDEAELIEEGTDLSGLTRDADEIIETYRDLPLKEIPFREVFKKLFDILRQYKIHPPREFSIMLKSLMTIESFANKLDEDFQIIDYLKPYARKFAYREFNPSKLTAEAMQTLQGTRELITRFPEDAGAIINKIKRGNLNIHIHHEHLEELEKTVSNSFNRLSFAMTIAGLLVGSSYLIQSDRTILGAFKLEYIGLIGYGVAGVMGLWLLIAIIRSGRL